MAKRNLKFIVDVGVGKKVESFLFESEYDIKSVREIEHEMKDSEILKIANDEKRIVITMDKDFGELIFNSGLTPIVNKNQSTGKYQIKFDAGNLPSGVYFYSLY